MVQKVSKGKLQDETQQVTEIRYILLLLSPLNFDKELLVMLSKIRWQLGS